MCLRSIAGLFLFLNFFVFVSTNHEVISIEITFQFVGVPLLNEMKRKTRFHCEFNHRKISGIDVNAQNRSRLHSINHSATETLQHQKTSQFARL